MADNFFDQFDASAAKPDAGGNYFDRFDEAATPQSPQRTLAGTARDIGVTALKGAVGLPQAVVGLADIPTGGRVGKALEGAGLRFKDAQDALGEMYSPAQQAANRKVREAEGFVGTAQAMLENPSTIATGIGESLPQMLGGAGVARGILAAAPRVGAVAAGALGEGVMGAGSAAEQIRGETADGLLTGKQAALAGASGAATAALGALGGKVAQRLGVGDVDTMLAQGSTRAVGQGSTRSMPRQIIEGGVAEGALEEMPQSVAEQALQNVALERPWDEGVGAAAAQGLITGAAMGGAGGGVGAVANRAQQRAEVQALQRTQAAIDSAETLTQQAQDEQRTAAVQSAQDAAVARAGALADEEAAAPIADDGGAAAREQQVVAQQLREQAQAASRGEASPDDEIYQSTGAGVPVEPMPQGAVDDALDLRAPSEQMGINPAAGPLSRAAAQAVDTQAVQSGNATGFATTADQGAYESGALAFQQGATRQELAAIPNVAARLQHLRGYDDAARQAAAATPAAPAASTTGDSLARQAQTVQASTQQPQAGGQAPAGRAAAGEAQPVPAAAAPAGGGGLQAAGLSEAPRYIDKKKFPAILAPSGLQLSRVEQVAQGTGRILSEKNLVGYRRANDPAFSFAGQQAATADRHALASAQQRLEAGEDAEAVRRDTGWHRGADGKWRFEISDQLAHLKGTGTFGDVVMRRMAALEQAGSRQPGDPVRLEDVLYHGSLFAAYPGLKDIEVQFTPPGTKAKGRLAQDGTNTTIQLSEDLPGDEALSVLLHEVQHGIQNIEGFATGGSPDAWMIGRLNPKTREAYERALDALPDDATEAEVKALARDVYRRLAGEVESRNTQARQSLTDEQRRATPPSSTTDVADADVIVTFNGKEMASAPAPVNTGFSPEQAAAIVSAARPPSREASAGARRLSDERLVATQMLVDGLTERWSRAPEIIVARNMQDSQIPQHVRDYDAKLKSQGASGEPQGFIVDGKVYLLSDTLSTPNDIATVLFHEVLGHWGLRRAFGDTLDPVLRQVAVMRGKDVRAKAREYGLDMTKEGDRLIAAEEVLAEMAQTNPQLTLVQRAISAIRNWLRANVPGFKALAMTNNDIIQAFILPARGAVTRQNETMEQAIDRAVAAVRGEDVPRFSQAPATKSEAFKRWFGDSKVVDEDGRPLVVYHGTVADFDAFDNAKTGANDRGLWGRGHYFSASVDNANSYALRQGDGARLIPTYVSIKNPLVLKTGSDFVTRLPDGTNTRELVGPNLDGAKIKQIALDGGHDGVIQIRPNGLIGDLVAYSPEQIKSATGNNGQFDPSNPDIRFSRSAAVTPAAADYTPAQQRAAERAFGAITRQTWAERAQSFRANLGTKLRQGIVDQFAPIKEVSAKAYMLARLSKGSDGAVEAALLYGKPFLRDGVYDVDMKDGGFAQVLAGLKGEHDRFFQWVAAQRAERLKAEGKENLLTDRDITALKSLNAGRFADGAPRMPVYAAALRELNAFNEAALKVAMESGLIDQAAYELMKDQPYVPFYRLMQEGDMRGPRFSSGLVNQQAWKKLKGGSQQLNADLLQNTLMNWSHLYAAAARNRASLETMAAADKMGTAYQVPADTKGAVKVMRDGVAEHWAVEDPYLLDAIMAMSYAPGGLVKAMAPFKRLLTFGVTVNPTFKIRNLIRDSLSAVSQSDLGYNPFANVASGWKATGRDSQTYASMLASGGIIKFGTQENTSRVRAQIERLGGQMLDKQGFDKFTGQMKALWEAYEEFGDRTENVNRAALYERLIAKGHSHAEASFMARDLMDFSMSGKWEVVRFLAQTVPFLNARLQGLYKLGRAAKEDPRRFAAMAGAVSMASLGLMAAYGDDDDWKKREDWDRDAYWWFKVGNTAFRIPKPFELGSIGTLAERTAELMMSDEMTAKRFGARISDMVFNTFAMDPTPQFIKPFIDVYANKDSFSGRAIEGMADERLRPQDRYNERTSEIARLLGSWGLPDPVRLAKGEYSGLSPKQIDFLLRGYFGWLATVTTTVTDMAARPVLDRGDRPAMRMRDTFLAGNFVEALPTGSSRYVTAMYEQARDVEQAWASYQAAVKSGDMDKAREIQQDEAPKLRNRLAIANAKRQIAELGQQAKRIEGNRLLSADQKREQLDAIEARKHQVAQRVAVTG